MLALTVVSSPSLNTNILNMLRCQLSRRCIQMTKKNDYSNYVTNPLLVNAIFCLIEKVKYLLCLMSSPHCR